MIKAIFLMCLAITNANLIADQLNFKLNNPITYEYSQEINLLLESYIDVVSHSSKKITFDIKLLSTNNGKLPFEVEVVIKNLKFNILNNNENKKLISYSSENQDFIGLHHKITSLYDSIINKPLRYRIDESRKATELTGTFKELNKNISSILLVKGIDDNSLAEIVDEFDEIIGSFFDLADIDIALIRYDINFPKRKEIKSGNLYYDISAIDSDKIQYNIGGYMTLDVDDIRSNIDGKAEINCNNALIQKKFLSMDADGSGKFELIPYTITMKGTETLTAISE